MSGSGGRRSSRRLLMLTAAAEGATAAFLLVNLSFVLWLLLGRSGTNETAVVARFAGAALAGFSILCWPRSILHGERQVLIGVLTYDVAAALLLTYAGWFESMTGPGLWPAVVVHGALAVRYVRRLGSRTTPNAL